MSIPGLRFTKLVSKVRRLKGTTKPPAVTIFATGRAVFSAAAVQLLREVGLERGLTMDIAGLELYLSEDGRLLTLVPSRDPEAVQAKALKGKSWYTADLSSLLEALGVPPRLDFSFVCPVSIDSHPELGPCIVVHLGDELARLRARRRQGEKPSQQEETSPE